MSKRTKTSSQGSAKVVYILISIVVLVVAVLVFLVATHRVSWFQNRVATSGTIPAVHENKNTSQSQTKSNHTSQQSSTNPTNGSGQSSASQSSTSTTTSNVSAQKSPNSGPAPIVPYGDFVSNHNPSLSGNLSNEESVCNTTPGATCYIEFTQGGIIKKLPVETADSNGTVYWSWNVNTSGFTTGKWQITAVATMNGQSVSANDELDLNVQP